MPNSTTPKRWSTLTTVVLIVVVVPILWAAETLFYLGLSAFIFQGSGQPPVESHIPFPSIKVLGGPNPDIVWKIDRCFAIEFDNGFVIDSNASLNLVPKNWIVMKEGGQLEVRDEQSDFLFTADIDSGGRFIELNIRADQIKASMKDLRTNKSIRLSRNNTENLVAFFKAVPR